MDDDRFIEDLLNGFVEPVEEEVDFYEEYVEPPLMEEVEEPYREPKYDNRKADQHEESEIENEFNRAMRGEEEEHDLTEEDTSDIRAAKHKKGEHEGEKKKKKKQKHAVKSPAASTFKQSPTQSVEPSDLQQQQQQQPATSVKTGMMSIATVTVTHENLWPPVGAQPTQAMPNYRNQYDGDLGGLGQVGVFTGDSFHRVQPFDSFTLFIILLLIFYIRT